MGLCMGLSFVSVFEVNIMYTIRGHFFVTFLKVLVLAFQWIKSSSYFMTEAKSK